MADRSQGYGQYASHYPPPPSFPPVPVPSNTQLPFSYPAPGIGMMPPENYTATYNAYDHNSNRIPGLGLGGTPIPPTTSFPTGAPQSWPASGQRVHTNQFFPNHQPAPPSLAQQPPVPYQQPHNPLEDGELDEEFEDLYDPKGPATVPQDPPQVTSQPRSMRLPNNLQSRNGSIGDAEGSSIYDPQDPNVIIQGEAVAQAGVEQDDPMDDDWEPSYLDRERSGSYSPHLSPREVHRKISMAKATSHDTHAADNAQPHSSVLQTSVPLPTTSGTSVKYNGTTTIATPVQHSGPAVSSVSSEQEIHTNGSLPLRSPLDAKKKAQEAILGLWPLKVRYQDYIDEGIDANVVKALFKDIGLDVPISKNEIGAPKTTTTDAPIIPAKATPTDNTPHTPQSPVMRTTKASPEVTKKPDDKHDKSKSSETKVVAKSAAEERKDKIARKLAAMAQKTTTAPSPGKDAPVSTSVSIPAPAPVPVAAPSVPPISAPAPVPTTIPPPAPNAVSTLVGTKSSATNSPSVDPKIRAEKNAILHQKLAALKKQQAQLAADKAQAASNDNTATSSPAPTGPSPIDTTRNGDSTPKTISTPPVQQGLNHQSSSTAPQSNPSEEGIPGLSFPSLASPQPSQGTPRTLKRPVASDFDNYTPRYETLKRTRTDERLIIDVSDDDDVEMEIGSPTEDLPASVDSSSTPAHQALSSFPPLSDVPNRRQQDSPVSSSAPKSPVRGARIDLLHKKIEEMNRLIAEAEAKKKAAKETAVQSSPKPSSPVAEQTISLPKVRESKVKDSKAVSNRRDRIVSYELPRVGAALKDKQEKLRQIFAEAARLELEVQASLDEEQRLKAEIECLVEPSTANSPEPSESLPKLRDILSQPVLVTASKDEHTAQDEHLDNSQALLPETKADTESEPKTDQSLDVSDDIDKTYPTDIEMADADLPAPSVADAVPIIDEPLTGETLPSPPQADGSTQDDIAETEEVTTQHAEGLSTNTDIGATSMTELAPAVVSSPSNESDDASSESDVSMQQSIADLSESDEDGYEPTPVEIPDSHDAQKEEQELRELPDEVPDEPNPMQTSIDQHNQRSEHISNEVKDRSCEEPLLLTCSQDIQNNKPSLEDLLSYKSPLSYFRAYRFHPKYFDEVSGGLKSMTFNARIDPMREVCPRVLAGESCPKGSSCEYQHFDSMVLQDAEIITQLGSADMFVGETRTKFIEGLKKVLNELKANRVKDFDRITKAIVKHRQEFLGDKTKVLALDSSAT
ncbi:hypothetical protein F5Y08DRAFT_309738 [Xylaria arbuscula]|nr:hypothetical protein F5Y08DRAFT_309738 [Xylaria arbuscula]